jgi:A/G-specific adenine glycosylase
MELGATLCLPKRPQCLICPVSTVCHARLQGRQEQFPVKVKPQKSVQEDRTLFWVEQEGRILLWQRADTARLMPGFWELPERTQLPGADGPLIGTFRHGITYHDYRFSVVSASTPADLGDCQWVEKTELLRMPISTIVRKAHKMVEKAKAGGTIALPARAS